MIRPTTTTSTVPAAAIARSLHDDHTDYLHNGHWHAEHGNHYDEHINLDH